ncbi:piRNA biogenesis protein EXD1-like [Watersipora subatra]|uniref:piRNA biogenesis protein EXD1-like n=1 Tax=Watersipora subatra TaxID=2589382 RepID=UPI00355C2FD1
MASSSNKHILVETVEEVETAIKDLGKHILLSVDCEGVKLGRDGELCLLQVATSSKIYLFDIVVLKEKAFSTGLKDILESSTITKLLYDCREDCNALKCQYDVEVKGCGFSGYQKKKMHKAFDADDFLWRKRPISTELLTYAATGGYQENCPYFRTARLPERIIPEVSKVGSKLKFKSFPETGDICRSCNWKTILRSDGQCMRCYLIDHPVEFEFQYRPAKKL